MLLFPADENLQIEKTNFRSMAECRTCSKEGNGVYSRKTIHINSSKLYLSILDNFNYLNIPFCDDGKSKLFLNLNSMCPFDNIRVISTEYENTEYVDLRRIEIDSTYLNWA